MTTKSGAVHLALKARLDTLFATPVDLGGGDAVQVTVYAASSTFAELPDGACVVLPRGQANSEVSEFGDGQPTYEIVVTTPIEMHNGDLSQDRAETLRDTVTGLIVADLEANPLLGGAADDVEIRDFDPNEFGEEGTMNIASGILTVQVTIYSKTPI